MASSATHAAGLLHDRRRQTPPRPSPSAPFHAGLRRATQRWAPPLPSPPGSAAPPPHRDPSRLLPAAPLPTRLRRASSPPATVHPSGPPPGRERFRAVGLPHRAPILARKLLKRHLLPFTTRYIGI
ncbi:hypothetical protein GUJ93_ZPchr0001g31594 [Zizania palustris]|uniref:Uncharacterized protein n=1 Tax=Zizania palustris TaxID=103762 RepID=A0A8J5RU37_ZIZPA|nr:hypothetical protein GUJ93_ZPchr0001g31594 [Zizania palustris]